jgi:hypothetical protein
MGGTASSSWNISRSIRRSTRRKFRSESREDKERVLTRRGSIGKGRRTRRRRTNATRSRCTPTQPTSSSHSPKRSFPCTNVAFSSRPSGPTSSLAANPVDPSPLLPCRALSATLLKTRRPPDSPLYPLPPSHTALSSSVGSPPSSLSPALSAYITPLPHHNPIIRLTTPLYLEPALLSSPPLARTAKTDRAKTRAGRGKTRKRSSRQISAGSHQRSSARSGRRV